ncbi:hypothetical protein K488DRAFT_44898, partial [Vararia minispora EC-137]
QVGCVLLTDTAHQALITHGVYMYTIAHAYDSARFNRLEWSLVVEVIVNGVTALLVQSFFVMRIWTRNHGNIALLVLTCLCIATQFALHIGSYLHICTTLRADLSVAYGVSLAINGVTAFTDVLITTCLVYLLQRSRTTFSQTNTLITRLVNTGLLTSIDAVLSLITILAKPDTLIYLGIYYIIGRLYSNSFLATLNSRTSLRGVTSSPRNGDGPTIIMSTLEWSHRAKPGSPVRARSAKTDITQDYPCETPAVSSFSN